MFLDVESTSSVRPSRGRASSLNLLHSPPIWFFAVVDFATIMACGLLSLWLYQAIWPEGGVLNQDFQNIFGVSACLFVMLVHSRGGYSYTRILDGRSQIGFILSSWLAIVLVMVAIAYSLKVGGIFSRGAVGLFLLSSAVGLCVARAALYAALQRGIARGSFWWRRVVIVCEDSGGQIDEQMRSLTSKGIKPVATFRFAARSGKDWRSQIDEIATLVRWQSVDAIVVIAPAKQAQFIRRISAVLRAIPIPVQLLLERPVSELAARPRFVFGEHVAIELQREPLGRWERLAKRSLDVFVSAATLLCLAPLLILVAVAIKLSSPGPALFLQTRHGFNGRPFRILKFRTMNVQQDGADVPQAKRGDARVTPLGRLLRATSLDELPQLWNILRGDMSLVGPRPHAIAHGDHYARLIGAYAFRHHVKPGLTGWAQVNGSRGETPTVAHMARRVGYDVAYIDNWSFLLDLQIILRTVGLLLKRENAF